MNEREWTIMIYMAGDNNLAVDMAYALEQIKGVASEGDDSPNIFVYYDGNSPSIPTLYCDFSDPKDFKYASSYLVPRKLYEVPDKVNENAADRRSILNFVNWCLNDVEVRHPNGEITYGRRAKRYAMIFSGHSLGFQDIGLFKDETSGKTMKMNDLYFTLMQIVSTKEQLQSDVRGIEFDEEDHDRETTVLVGQKFDLLGFDACVMGMLEVGYQFNDLAHTMIASEGSVPSAGWTYATILGSLAKSKAGDDTPRQVAARFVRDFIRSQDAFTIGGSSVDLAAWDLERIPDLAIAFDQLAVALIDCFVDPTTRLYRQMEHAILHVHWRCQSYMFDQNVDLGDMCELLDAECEHMEADLVSAEELSLLASVRKACKDVLHELGRTVILSGYSGGEYQNSNGVSVFFPWSEEGYAVSKKNYESLFFTKDVKYGRNLSWIGFLKKYLNEVSLRRCGDLPVESKKIRYTSSYDFYGAAAIYSFDGDRKLAGQADSKLAGQADSKLAGQRDSKLAGQADSKLAGQRDSKLAGQRDSKLAGQRDSKLAGQRDSKLAGQRDSKLAGQRDSKLAGQRDSKLAGQRDSKLAGQRDSKLAGQRDSKLAGQRDSKLAGGSSASDAFFRNLQLFKNVEIPWNVSGFSRDPDE